MNHFICCALLAIFLGGCASSHRNLQDVDEAAARGGEALQQLCRKTGLSGACALSGSQNLGSNSLPVMQSLTSKTQARLVVLLPEGETVSYYLRRPKGLERLNPERLGRKNSAAKLDHLEVFHLSENETYELLIVGPKGELWDRRWFQSLNTERNNPKLLLVSCMDDSMLEISDQIWVEAANKKPDAILMIGDNVYADMKKGKRFPGDSDHIWNRYVETRSKLTLFRLPHLIPVFATWDDHDYGLNDSDRTFPLREESRETFFAFFAQKRPAPGFERGPGVSSRWSAFGVDFLLLDDRSFRSPNRLDLEDQTHFGVEQEQWMNQLVKPARRPVFLISGDQFFGGYQKFESYEGNHPKSFKQALVDWRKSKAPLVFLSGDRHLSEISQIPKEVLGYRTFEVTSSAIHAKVFPGNMTRDKNPFHLVGRDGAYNYSILELEESSPSRVRFSVSAFSLNNELLYKKELKVQR